MMIHREITFDSLNSMLNSADKNDLKEFKLNIEESNPRSRVLQLGACVGQLCSSLLSHAPLDPIHNVTVDGKTSRLTESHPFWSTQNQFKGEIATSIGVVFISLLLAARTFDVDLRECILKKMILNAKKYPVDLCKVGQYQSIEFFEVYFKI